MQTLSVLAISLLVDAGGNPWGAKRVFQILDLRQLSVLSTKTRPTNQSGPKEIATPLY